MVLRLAACLLLPIAVSTRTPRLAASFLRDAGPADYFELAPCRHGSPLAPPASGAAVIALQNALAGATWPTPEPLSGVFDTPTSESLRAFQAARGLAVDGIVGPATMAAFDAALGLAAAPSPGLLRISDAQVTPAITAGAERVLAADGRRDIGTEVAFQADNNRTWVGRIELHYHPFNGTMRPWGYHHGVSVFCTLDSSCVAPGGAAFLAATAGMTVPAREAAILQQLLARNMPPWLLSPPSLTVMVAGRGHILTFRAMPDVLAIGGADDFVRIPVAAPTAQRVADAFSASLPTTTHSMPRPSSARCRLLRTRISPAGPPRGERARPSDSARGVRGRARGDRRRRRACQLQRAGRHPRGLGGGRDHTSNERSYHP